MTEFKLQKTVLWHRLPDRWFDALAILSAILACVIYSALCGKDISWDQLNYHFYLPYSLLENRVETDFLPASGQSYLNPIVYVPFYLMVIHQWHSLLIASVLAIVQAANVVLAYFITKSVVAANIQYSRQIALLGATLAFLSPVFLSEVGTTLADAPTSALVLAAVLSGLHSKQESPWWRDRALLAGLLVGAACGMKLSNLVFGPPSALLVMLMQSTVTERVKAIVLLGIGSVCGLLVTHAYWSLQLWHAFGNPFMPFFENYFPTDIFPKESAALERFLPESFTDVLLVPFRMVLLRSWIYVEHIAPDLRFALLVLVIGFGCVCWLVSGKYRLQISNLCSRRWFGLCAFFVVSFGLWQWTTGNGRYGLVVLVLVGPILVLAIVKACRAETKAAIYIVVAVAVLQGAHLTSGSFRNSGYAWTPSWYPILVPERLKRERYLYVSVGLNSNSFVYPLLSAKSAFTNPIGQISVEFDGPGGKRLLSILDRFPNRLRVFAQSPDPRNFKQSAKWEKTIDEQVARLGYGLDASDCETIGQQITAPGQHPDAKTSVDSGMPWIRTCKLVPRPYALAAERARVTKIAKEIVSWCPKLFKPANSVAERSENGWTFLYGATDSTLIIKDGEITAVQFRAWADLHFGTLDQWEQGIRPSCANFPAKPRKVYTFY